MIFVVAGVTFFLVVDGKLEDLFVVVLGVVVAVVVVVDNFVVLVVVSFVAEVGRVTAFGFLVVVFVVVSWCVKNGHSVEVLNGSANIGVVW